MTADGFIIEGKHLNRQELVDLAVDQGLEISPEFSEHLQFKTRAARDYLVKSGVIIKNVYLPSKHVTK